MDAKQFDEEYLARYAEHWTPETVARKAQQLFPSHQLSEVMSALEAFDSRLQLCVLKLCNGSIEKLPQFVQTAKDDARDVMIPAEFPNDFNFIMTKGGETPPEVYDQDLQQYLDWIQGTD